MSAPVYRRVSSSDPSAFGSEHFTTLEAGFLLREDGYPFLSIKILGFDNTEIFSTSGLENSDVYGPVSYVNQALLPSFKSFIQDIEKQAAPEDECAYFLTIYPGATLEVCVAPVIPKEYRVTIYLYHYIVLGQYQWCDGGSISVRIMCKNNDLMNFLKQLNSDLEFLRSS